MGCVLVTLNSFKYLGTSNCRTTDDPEATFINDALLDKALVFQSSEMPTNDVNILLRSKLGSSWVSVEAQAIDSGIRDNQDDGHTGMNSNLEGAGRSPKANELEEIQAVVRTALNGGILPTPMGWSTGDEMNCELYIFKEARIRGEERIFSKLGERQRKRHSYHTIVRYEEDGHPSPRPYLADILYFVKAVKGASDQALRLAVCDLHPLVSIQDELLDAGEMYQVPNYNAPNGHPLFCSKYPVDIDNIDSKCVLAQPVVQPQDRRAGAYCMQYSKVSALW